MSCQTGTKAPQKGIKAIAWGKSGNEPVSLYTLTNQAGNQVTITTYGGRVTSWTVPDKAGNHASILVGFNNVTEYETPAPFFGAIIGRYGNRIAKGQFSLDGKKYTLPINDGPNHLHGGPLGFDKKVWTAEVADSSKPILKLTYLSKDGEEGYPGNLKVTVTYTYTDSDELKIDYEAQTDKPTIVNLTNHSYFNLSGSVRNTILDEKLLLNADFYTPVDTTLIPTGELRAVKGTPFDFKKATAIGSRIAQVKGGYDHNFVLDRKTGDNSLILAAVMSDEKSGRELSVLTTEPGIQFYAGNFLDGTYKSADGSPIILHSAFALETQHFPDSPNKPQFPSTELKPGQTYSSHTVYKFSLLK